MAIQPKANPILARTAGADISTSAPTPTPTPTPKTSASASDPITPKTSEEEVIEQTVKQGQPPTRSNAAVDALAAVTKLQETAREAADKARATVNAANKQTNIIVDSLSKQADLDQIQQEAAGVAALETQNKNTELMEISGGDLATTREFSKVNENRNKILDLNEQRAAIMDTERTGLPILDAIINTFAAVPVTAEADNLRMRQERLKGRMATTSALQTSTIAANNATSKTLNQASIEAKYDKIGEVARQNKAVARINSIAANADAMAAVVAADSAAVTAQMKALEVENSVEARTIQREQLALRKLEHEQKVQAHIDGEKLRKAQLAMAQSQLRVQEQTEADVIAGVAANTAQKEQTLALNRELKNDVVAQAKATLNATRVSIKTAEQNFDQSKATFADRQKELATKVAQGRATFDRTILELKKAQATAGSDVEGALARNEAAKVALAQAESNLTVGLATEQTKVNQAEQNLENSKLAFDINTENLAQMLKINPENLAQMKALNAKLEREQLEADAFENKLVADVNAAEAMLNMDLSSHASIIGALTEPSQKGSPSHLKYTMLQNIADNDRIGDTPADANNNLAALGLDKQQYDTKPMKFLRAVEREVERFYNTADADTGVKPQLPTTQLGVDLKFNEVARDMLARHAALIEDGDVKNPLLALPIDSIAQITAVKDSALYKTVIEPAGLAEVNVEQLVNATLSGLNANPPSLTMNQAAKGLQELFNGAVIMNSVNDGGLERIGLKTPTSYIVETPRTATFGESAFTFFSGSFAIPAITTSVKAAIDGELDTSLHKGKKFFEFTDMTNLEDVQLMLVKMRADDLRIPAPKAEGE